LNREQVIYKVHHIRELSGSAFVLRFDRHGLNFQPGQHILIGLDEKDMREYSVYSSANDNFLEVLVKIVDSGKVSKQLRKLTTGDTLLVENAVGFFKISPADKDKNLLFIASGTGIAPFHSMVKTFPEIDYKILHGISHTTEAYDKDDYDSSKLIICSTKDNKGDFKGRVTDYLKLNTVEKDTLVYLCGNSDMILDTKDLLEEQGLPNQNIFTEVYF
jgi:ferredoxin--NADP+ reductase/benzoate/toluate 1,2-dioxygenase reductase subunit